VIFDVGFDLRVRLGNTAELSLPIAIEDDPIDLASNRLCVSRPPTVPLGRSEVNVNGGAGRVVWVKQDLDRRFANRVRGDGGGNALAGHIGQIPVKYLRGICATRAEKASVKPLFGDALELTEQMKLRFFARIAPLGVKQMSS